MSKSGKQEPSSLLKRTVPQRVIRKLTFASLAMLLLPMTVFFAAHQGLGASSVISGGLAALTANVVLVIYVILAFSEDLAELNPELQSKKEK